MRSIPQTLPKTDTASASGRAELKGLRIFVAATERHRQRARILVDGVYRQKGYYASRTADWDSAISIKERNIVTFIAVDGKGRDAGAVTLVFDSNKCLPCDEIFPGLLKSLRTRGRRLVEVTRFAIAERYRNSRLLLVRLINAISVFARCVRPSDDFIIEINPHHAKFYTHLMLFEKISETRPCPRVGGAPAVLMRLNLHLQAKAIRQAQCAVGALRPRTIYREFHLPEFEGVLAASLSDPWIRHSSS